MKHRWLALVLLVVSLSGCYLGRAPTAKKIANGVNIASIVVGTLSYVSVVDNDDDEAELLATFSLIPIAIGLVGLGVNYIAGDKPTEKNMRLRPLNGRSATDHSPPRATDDGPSHARGGSGVAPRDSPCAPCTCVCPPL